MSPWNNSGTAWNPPVPPRRLPEVFFCPAGRFACCFEIENNFHFLLDSGVIPDAAACCAQGLEFVWKGEHTWPDDYPEEMTNITVTCTLAKYEELGLEYLHLVDADMVLTAPSV